MKIQNINNNNYINYKESTKPIKNEEPVKSKNYDVIEIKGKTSHDKNELSIDGIKNKVVNQINKETSADKISRIKESIENKTYSIDAEEVINKILKGWYFYE